MPTVNVAILAVDHEQCNLLQRLVDATASARTVLTFPGLPAGGADALLQHITELQPQVMLIDVPEHDPGPALSLIERLHAQVPKTAVFAVGDMNRRQSIVAAMRAGACEFLDQPPSTQSLLEAFDRLSLAKRAHTAAGHDRGKIIVLINAKGGCGTTTITANVAAALQETHGSCAVVDLALIGHVALHLNAKPHFTVVNALQNPHRLDGTLLEGLMTRTPSGVHLLAGAQVPTPLSPTEEEVGRLFELISSRYRFVLVDASSRLDPMVRMVCGVADTVLLISETDMVALLWNAARVHSYLGNLGRDKVRLVLNRFRKTPEYSDADAEAATDAKILWKIPSQGYIIGPSIDKGIPAVLQKSSEVAHSFRGLAAVLAQSKLPPSRGAAKAELATRLRALT